jgi:molybdopterin molybdotransferase
MKQDNRLRNDCFAMPRGVSWTPVDKAIEQLKRGLSNIKGTEVVSTTDGMGRILASSVCALSSNPPYTNSAVDGYGFCGPTKTQVSKLKVIPGVAAAGAPFVGKIPKGSALRILTGAVLPEGVDTVLLEEDIDQIDNFSITFEVFLNTGANTRKSGEDVLKGEQIFAKGHKLRPQDLALLVATGNLTLNVFCHLKVGIFSTGNELLDAHTTSFEQLEFSRIFDSNRPMLLSLIANWGFEVFDFGIINDDVNATRDSLNKASKSVDAIITSGGASAGDEDYVSRLIKSEGQLENWRIAIKPGRPLALGLWKGIPIFGLPGNPVAALVCSLIFVKPSLGLLAGCNWIKPQSYLVPSGFDKEKKIGRREYLRARLLADGDAEIFPSEGSGRISSLSWSTGLLELMDNEDKISKGDMVKYIPYSSF